ncbi:glycosyltransferase family 2 protein [Anaerosacchariphilus polymeriproducens]|uniref:Glycosyltransferase n=1 Tax=Anaerosacchariphilus polymeriproducens TaxID=1812858 RepID=A0A371AY16_9FIRM|nr:glycosyltransferase family 2 protein [Anaerosacchariphilus polymeriproducens]RDU24439.1 glycosyltransferase [Anaerosacchariphilus polymeriproducens]
MEKKLDKKSKLLSVIVPCYNEEQMVPIFFKEICKTAEEFKEKNVEFEFIFVDDGSKDRTLEELKKIRKLDSRVRYCSFSRNFGKEAAIYAGLQTSKGDYVVLMDADLQDPPAYLMQMYQAITEEGYDCAATRRMDRKGEAKLRSFFARLFYRIINKISSADIMDGARDYRLMKRQVVDAILSMCEYNRFTKGIFGWVGFKTKWIAYENVERVAGDTKWSFWSLLTYALDGIIAFSTTPLAIASFSGVLLSGIALLFIIGIILRTLILGDPVAGWPSLVCIILLLSGIQLLCMGIIGQYLAKAYMETKKRPVYICRETEETEEEEED